MLMIFGAALIKLSIGNVYKIDYFLPCGEIGLAKDAKLNFVHENLNNFSEMLHKEFV